MQLSILADQLGASAGGGRFTTGFLRALLSDSEALERFEKLYILVTENQATSELGLLPPWARVIHRRFPSRLRQTFMSEWASRMFPFADVAHGPFFYVFPSQGRHTLITLHDVSLLDDNFHAPERNRVMRKMISHQVEKCAAIVCDSRAVLAQVQNQWPQMSNKCHAIYPGVDALNVRAELGPNEIIDPATILVVGTIEPRKNYSIILDAYEKLLYELPGHKQRLVVVGKAGWMSEAVCKRLAALTSRGLVEWIQNATDADLIKLYQKATVFTYLSVYEGFGYPPFEASYASVPMVVSATSSIGEIWSGYAHCVEPTDVRGIVNGWKWALRLNGRERQAVVEKQKKRTLEFTWQRCVSEYVRLYEALALRP